MTTVCVVVLKIPVVRVVMVLPVVLLNFASEALFGNFCQFEVTDHHSGRLFVRRENEALMTSRLVQLASLL